MTRRAGNLEGVSAERIGQEFRRMAAKGRWGPAMRLISRLGLEEALLGHAVQGGDWLRCDHQDLRDPPPAAQRFEPAMAAWILDRAEGTVDQACCESVGDRLVFSNQERARLGAIISVHERVNAEWDGASVATCKRLASSDVFETCIELIRAVDGERAGSIEARVEVLAETDLAPVPLVAGGDLLAAGLAAGPEMGEILDAVYDAQLEGRLPDRESAIEMAIKLASGDHAEG
jgi:tRNA nucleotidyltransferase/poly(A) polymerase